MPENRTRHASKPARLLEVQITASMARTGLRETAKVYSPVPSGLQENSVLLPTVGCSRLLVVRLWERFQMLIPTSSAYSWISFQPWACELGWLAQLLGSVPA